MDRADPEDLEARLAKVEAELDAMALELLDRYEELTVLYDLSAALGGVFEPAAQCTVAVERALRAVRASACEVHLDRVTSGNRVVASAQGATLVVPVESVGPDGGTEILGVLELTSASFDAGQVKVAAAVGRQLGAALQTGRMVASLKDAARLEHELGLAAEIQASLLPSCAPDVEGLDLAGFCRPASQVGGDYYDFLIDQTGALSIVIADVAGHSVGSALMMAMARSLLRRDLGTGQGPAKALAATNRALYDDLVRSGLFITAFAARYESATGTLRYTNGAHNPALLVRVGDDGVEPLDSDGMAVGMLEAPAYATASTELRAGDLVLFHTDGVTEARDATGELFGEERLHRLLRELAGRGASDVVGGIVEAVDAHTGEEAQQDDITLVAMVVLP